MKILVFNLKENSVEVKEEDLSSSFMLTLDLYDKYGEDAFLITSTRKESLKDSSLSSWSIAYYSEITKKREYSALCYPHGLSLRYLGYDALVILGRSEKLKYILLTPSGGEIIPCEQAREMSSLDFEKISSRNQMDLVLSTGRAGDKGVWYSELQFRGRNIPSLSSGHAFYLHNLKGIVFPSFPLFNEGKNDKSEKKKIKKIKRLRRYGSYTFIDSAIKNGYIPINYYSSRFNARSYNLTSKALLDKFGFYPESCGECLGECFRRTKEGEALPSALDIFSLGTNLGFFDIENINQLYKECIDTSLNTQVVGSILSYIFTLSDEERKEYGLENKNIPSIVSFIQKLSTGSILFRGLEDLPLSISSENYRPIVFDLRGSYSSALEVSLGLEENFTPLMLIKNKNISNKVTAIATLYTLLLSLGLSSSGHPILPTLLSLFHSIPSFAFSSSLLFKMSISLHKASTKKLIRDGYEVYRSLGLSFSSIPKHFLDDGESKMGYRTVPLRSLQEEWNLELLKIEKIYLKSKKKRENKESRHLKVKES